MTHAIVRCFAFFLMAALACCNAIAQTESAPGAAKPERPKSAKQLTRVFVKDIEGLWITADYASALRATRMPHQAARKARPVVVNIQKEGRSYPILRTDFDKAVMQRVLDIEPDKAPGTNRIVAADTDTEAVSAAEATYIPFRGQKGVQGRFDTLSMAEPMFSRGKFRTYIRLVDSSLVGFINGTVLAGRYADEQGRVYQFTEAGEATFPDLTFPYEISLAALGATCDYFETPDDKAPGGKRRTGFGWADGKLQLFEATGATPAKVRCARKPFAVLSPQPSEGAART